MFNTKLCVSLQISAHNGDFFYDCQAKQGRWNNLFASYPQAYPGRVNVSWINAPRTVDVSLNFTSRLHKLVLAPTCHDVFETKISQPHFQSKTCKTAQGFCWTHQLKVIASTWHPAGQQRHRFHCQVFIGTWLRSCGSCILWPAISSLFFHNLKGEHVQT